MYLLDTEISSWLIACLFLEVVGHNVQPFCGNFSLDLPETCIFSGIPAKNQHVLSG